jgi:hypothetical protein
VKNIFTLFQNWVEVYSRSEFDLSTALVELISSHGGYNDGLAVSLSKHSKLNSSFFEFCDDQATDCLNISSVQHKKLHLKTLNKFRQLCLDATKIKDQRRRYHQQLRELNKQAKCKD